MAQIRRCRKDQWLARIRRKGFPEVSKYFPTCREAEDWAAATEHAMRQTPMLPPDPLFQMTLGEALARYQREVTPKKKGAHTEGPLIDRMRARPELASLNFATATAKQFADYRDARLKEKVLGTNRTVSNQTVRHELARLSHLYTIARQEWDMDIPNPLLRVRKPAKSDWRNRRLLASITVTDDDGKERTMSEEERLIQACGDYSQELQDVVIIAMDSAMRANEILTLNVAQVRWDQRCINLHRTKNGDWRVVPLTPRAFDILMRRAKTAVDGKLFTFSRNYCSVAFSRVKKRAGLVNLRLHDLRHEGTSRLFEIPDTPLNVIEVATVTGHRDLTMLSRYSHVNTAQKIGAAFWRKRSTEDLI